MQNPFRNRILLQISIAFMIGIIVAFFWQHIFWIYVAIIVVLTFISCFIPRIRKSVLMWSCSLLIGMFILMFHRQSLQVTQLPAVARLQGKVDTLPRFNGRSTQIILSDVVIDDTSIHKKVSLYVTGDVDILYGATVAVEDAKLTIPRPKRNPGGIDAQINAWSKGVAIYANAEPNQVAFQQPSRSVVGTIFSLRARMESALKQNMTPSSFGLIKGMLFGDTSDMDQEWLDAFQVTGITHVIAVSGQHVTIVATVMIFLFSKLRKKTLSLVLTAAMVVVYCVMAGFSASVSRAAIMCILGLLATYLGERVDVLTLLGVSAIIGLLINPFQLFTAGFLLSYLAVFGIVAFSKPLLTIFKKASIFRKGIGYTIAQMLSVSIAAQLGILPVQLVLFGTLPTFSLLVNLIIAPFVDLSAVTGLLGAVLGMIWLPLGAIPAWITEACMQIVSLTSLYASKFPNATMIVGAPSIFIAISIILLSIGLWRWTSKKRSRVIFIGSAVALFCISIPVESIINKNKMEVVFLDVGQGDAIYIRQGNMHVLLDSGNRLEAYDYDNGKTVILPFLYHEGVGRLDAVIASHADSDHAGGLVSVVENMPVDAFLCGPDGLTDTENILYQTLLQELKKQNTPIQRLSKGDTFTIGQATVDVLAPFDDISEGNAASLVLNMQFLGSSFLFTGDAEFATEYDMVKAGLLHPIDVLKAGHHGSKNATSDAFLQVVQPKVTILSVGENNRYGHPTSEVLERLEKSNTVVYRTDKQGAILMYVTKKGIAIETMRDDNAIE